MIAVLAAALLGLAWAIAAIQSRRSAPISERHGIRAWLLMPKALRNFPVEEFARPGDRFLYTTSARPASLRLWRLQINTAREHREHWERALSSYAVKRRLEGRGSHHRGANKIYTEYRVSNGDYCWLKFEQARGSGDLHVSFIYQVRPANRKLMKCMNEVAFRVRQLWHILRGDGFDFDSITRAS
jgi:hypothetical protein